MAMGDVLAAGTIGFDPVNNPQFSVSEEELALHDPNMPTISRPALEPLQAPTILTPEQEEFYYSDISPFKEGRALPGTNSQITMAQIRTEVSGSGQCSLNDAEFRALINKNSGQQQAMSDYWGKSSELVYGQNTAAQGGFGSIGGGPNYDYGTTGNANRYVKGGVKNSTTNSYVECSYWVFIPLSQPINRGTVLKLDYSFTHNVNFPGESVRSRIYLCRVSGHLPSECSWAKSLFSRGLQQQQFQNEKIGQNFGDRGCQRQLWVSPH